MSLFCTMIIFVNIFQRKWTEELGFSKVSTLQTWLFLCLCMNCSCVKSFVTFCTCVSQAPNSLCPQSPKLISTRRLSHFSVAKWHSIMHLNNHVDWSLYLAISLGCYTKHDTVYWYKSTWDTCPKHNLYSFSASYFKTTIYKSKCKQKSCSVTQNQNTKLKLAISQIDFFLVFLNTLICNITQMLFLILLKTWFCDSW